MNYIGSNDNKQRIRAIYEHIEIATNQAFHEGLKLGVKMKKPTQEEFHEQHQEPMEYMTGKQSLATYVISGKLKKETAVSRFEAFLVRKNGELPAGFNVSDNVEPWGITLTIDDRGEPDFYLANDIDGIYPAWILETKKWETK